MAILRKILILLLVSTALRANTYYVATTGNDSDPGTITEPWLTWNYAFNRLVAGDTLYIRGGTYQPVGTFSDAGFGDTFSAVSIHSKNGTALNRIVVMGYPGERAILDGVNVTQGADTTSRHGIKATYCDYWTFKNFEVTGFVQLTGQLGVAPIQFQEHSDYNEFIGLKIYENGGSGIRIIYDCNGNLIYNCDSWLNYDHLSVPTPGNNSDGFEIADITDTTYVNTIRGCRAWDNSDDGIDLFRNEGVVYVDSTWCFYNGVTASYPATGFKLGGDMTTDVFKYRRFVTNCMAINNNREGFTINASPQPKMQLYNNFAYGNYYGFEMYTLNAPTDTSIFRNNIAYGNDVDDWRNNYSTLIITNNNYDPDWQPLGPVCDATDFVTLDTLGLRYSRKANGCLPDIQFARLAATSDMIDAGVDVGIDYEGSAPDIGPFEYKSRDTFIKSSTGRWMKTTDGRFLIID